MAKVTGGLFSMTSSGQFGKALVFDTRGIVRVYKKPANPKTSAQGDQRQRMLNLQRAIGRVGSVNMTMAESKWLKAYKDSVPNSYRWQAHLLGECTKAADYDASATAWGALDSTAKTAWGTQATAASLTAVEIDYAAETVQTAGQALFHLARAIWLSGSYDSEAGSAGAIPGASNAQNWYYDITGDDA